MIYVISHKRDTLNRLKKYKNIYKPRGTQVFLEKEDAIASIKNNKEAGIFLVLEDYNYIQVVNQTFQLIDEMPIIGYIE